MNRPLHRLSVLMLFVVSATWGCGGEVTAAGTAILDESLEGDVTGTLTGNDESHREITLGGGATIDVKIVAGQSGGGRYVRHVTLTVVDPMGAKVSGTLTGNPENQGTTDAVIHARLILVSEERSGLTGSSLAQTSLRVRGDGTVETL